MIKFSAAASAILIIAGTVNPVHAQTVLENDVAAAAGRAAGRVASQAVTNAIVRGATRLKGPACRAGANDLRLQGIRHAIFVAERRKVL
jgi:cyanophycinase-like exopeptidase